MIGIFSYDILHPYYLEKKTDTLILYGIGIRRKILSRECLMIETATLYGLSEINFNNTGINLKFVDYYTGEEKTIALYEKNKIEKILTTLKHPKDAQAIMHLCKLVS
jgi:hypothetical protein